MGEEHASHQHLNDLRQRAEAQLQQVMSSLDDRTVEDVQALLHDLHVHQIELTLQNEELRRTQAELEVSHENYAGLYEKYRDLYDFAPVGYCTLEKDGTILDINLTAASQLGIEREALLKTRLYHQIAEEDRETFFLHLRQAFETNIPQTCELRLLQPKGSPFWGQLESFAVQEDIRCEEAAKAATTNQKEAAKATVISRGAAVASHCRTTITDITEGKRIEEQLNITLREKDVLMREILHRTKNNMASIVNLLQLQAMYDEDGKMTPIFRQMGHRIDAMMFVQQKLYQSEDFVNINLKDYLDELAYTIFFNLRVGRITLHLETESVIVPPDTAIPCGLILNELMTNALKHAFPTARNTVPEQADAIRISLHCTDTGTIELRVSDNGVGMPQDFDLKTSNSLGLKLITGFVQQLKGSRQLRSGRGTEWRIRFAQS